MSRSRCKVEFPRRAVRSSEERSPRLYHLREFLSSCLSVDRFEAAHAEVLRVEGFREHITIVDEEIPSVDIHALADHQVGRFEIISHFSISQFEKDMRKRS